MAVRRANPPCRFHEPTGGRGAWTSRREADPRSPSPSWQPCPGDREGLFERRPYLALFRERILCVALCQGGALHYVDGRNGVNDLDVWTFYEREGDHRFPPRRRGVAQYYGSGLTDWSERVDMMGRCINKAISPDPVASLHEYLRRPPTGTAWFLAKKAAVLIEPASRLGEVVWPAPLQIV